MKKWLWLALPALMMTGCSGAANEADTAPAQSIALSSVANARELGGYVTREGKRVRRGALLRTAVLTGLSQKEQTRLLEEFRLSAIVDFRASFELKNVPEITVPGVRQVNLKILDEGMKAERVEHAGTALTDPKMDPVTRMMKIVESGIISDQMYVEFLSTEQGKAGYRAFFRVLLDTPQGGSVLWHCTSGKDRTGVAAMLVLGALGVDEDTIMADYMLTNAYFEEEISRMRQKLEPVVQDKALLEELMVVGRGVCAPYMRNAIDFIKENYGDIAGYAKAELGLSEADIETLKELYTE